MNYGKQDEESKSLNTTATAGFVSIDCAIEFAVNYGESVCHKCSSQLVVHKLEQHHWTFRCAMCRQDISRQLVQQLDRWSNGATNVRCEDSHDS